MKNVFYNLFELEPMEKELTRYALKSGYLEKVVCIFNKLNTCRVISERHGKRDCLCLPLQKFPILMYKYLPLIPIRVKL